VSERATLMQILNLARWAPSGDNTQPWRFEILGDDRIAIHGFDTRDTVLYDFDGHASHIAHGALLETLRIAASGHACGLEWQLRSDGDERHPVYEARIFAEPGGAPDPLFTEITRRVVQRRPMRTQPLSDAQRAALRSAVGEAFELRFYESFRHRLQFARLLWDNAYIRLTAPEAFEVHRSVIEWGARYSEDRIPDEAVGVDRATARLMRWAMQSWGRVDFLNRYLLGTVAPRVQLDFLPALACAGHFTIQSRRPPRQLLDFVEAGMAVQRLWLTASTLNLLLQPEMTPVIFGWFVRSARSISARPGLDRRAAELTERIAALVGEGEGSRIVFMGRIGEGRQPWSRSTRLQVERLMR